MNETKQRFIDTYMNTRSCKRPTLRFDKHTHNKNNNINSGEEEEEKREREREEKRHSIGSEAREGDL